MWKRTAERLYIFAYGGARLDDGSYWENFPRVSRCGATMGVDHTLIQCGYTRLGCTRMNKIIASKEKYRFSWSSRSFSMRNRSKAWNTSPTFRWLAQYTYKAMCHSWLPLRDLRQNAVTTVLLPRSNDGTWTKRQITVECLRCAGRLTLSMFARYS